MIGTTPGPLAAEHNAALQRLFLHQPFIVGLGARLVDLAHGRAAVVAEATPALLGAGGTVHPGVVTALAESAAAMAVLASLANGAACRVVEHKIDFAGAMAGRVIEASASMVRPGGSLSVVRVEVMAGEDTSKQKLAVMLATYLHGARG